MNHSVLSAADSSKIDLQIIGMTCAPAPHAWPGVEKALLKVPGVSAASVNLATERATVQALP